MCAGAADAAGAHVHRTGTAATLTAAGAASPCISPAMHFLKSSSLPSSSDPRTWVRDSGHDVAPEFAEEGDWSRCARRACARGERRAGSAARPRTSRGPRLSAVAGADSALTAPLCAQGDQLPPAGAGRLHAAVGLCLCGDAHAGAAARGGLTSRDARAGAARRVERPYAARLLRHAEVRRRGPARLLLRERRGSGP